MKKIIIFILFIIFLSGFIYYIYNSNRSLNSTYSSNYTAERTSLSQFNIVEAKNTTKENTSNKKNESQKIKKKNSNSETISQFSTTLPEDTKARYSNIDLACDTLNGTIVKSGGTFSLWNTLGCPTKQKGYRKAKAFTNTGKIRYSYGGGICQVSTTIYNALLKVNGIKMLERHEHSRDVVYIKDGKDAAVSYKSADLRFKNELDYDIRLKATVKNNKIVISLEKI